MAEDGRDDADNEITRIVRRPGPASLPINVARPASVIPPNVTDPTVIAPKPMSAANDAAPSVAPPMAIDRPRPVMMPPPRPSTPQMSAPPMPTPPMSAPPPSAVRPEPIVVRPAPPVPPGVRLTPPPERAAPAPAEIAQGAPAPDAALVVAPAPSPVPVQAKVIQPAPIASPAVVAPVVAVTPVQPPADVDPVVGWLVVVKGPGRGTAREIVSGRNGIGSAVGQAIRLDFGDAAIALQGHAYVVYDDEAREFVVEDGKQKIVVRLNGKLLTETMPIGQGDELRIGATTLRFVALCGPDFDWGDKDEPAAEPMPMVNLSEIVGTAEPVSAASAVEGFEAKSED